MQIFPETVGRWEFAARYTIATAVVLLVGRMIAERSDVATIDYLVASIIQICGVIFIFFGVVIPRINAVKHSRWLSLLILIPFVSFAYALILFSKPDLVGGKPNDTPRKLPDHPIPEPQNSFSSPQLKNDSKRDSKSGDEKPKNCPKCGYELFNGACYNPACR